MGLRGSDTLGALPSACALLAFSARFHAATASVCAAKSALSLYVASCAAYASFAAATCASNGAFSSADSAFQRLPRSLAICVTFSSGCAALTAARSAAVNRK